MMLIRLLALSFLASGSASLAHFLFLPIRSALPSCSSVLLVRMRGKCVSRRCCFYCCFALQKHWLTLCRLLRASVVTPLFTPLPVRVGDQLVSRQQLALLSGVCLSPLRLFWGLSIVGGGGGIEAKLPVLKGKVWSLCQTTRHLCFQDRGDEIQAGEESDGEMRPVVNF